MKPKIFVTNDDGIYSPGLKAAARAVMPLGEVTVVAPTRQGTSMGRCLRGGRDEILSPIEYEIDGTPVAAWHIDASPAMAVKHGMDILFAEKPPALIVSGINYGENLGVHITHSGTVGAALQGTVRGTPAIAASLQSDFQYHFKYGEMDWHASEHHVRFFASMLLNRKMPFDVDVLKLDVPASATAETPWRLTRLSRQPYYKSVVDNPGLDSKIGDARLLIKVDHQTLEPESDIYAFVVDKVVSVTPLSLDLSTRVDLAELETLLNNNE